MAEIFETTLVPGKLQLIAGWLPRQPWYTGSADPQLSSAGGFRIDDPAGEVGIEFHFVTDESSDTPTTYQVPLTYRGTPLDGADAALIGTTEHGVLGRRWVYDGAHDPVLVAQLLAVVQGQAEPQMQRESFAPDPSVVGRSTRPGSIAPVDSTLTVTDSVDGSSIAVETAADDRAPAGALAIALLRTLGRPEPDEEFFGSIEAQWQPSNGSTQRGPVVLVG